MHPEIMIWFRDILKVEYPELFESQKILDCGSLDRYGRVQVFFDYKEYIGIDHKPGLGVGYVSLIHEYREKPDGYFNLVLCIETLEHDPYWQKSTERMLDLLGVGGNLILTMANKNREPHEFNCSPILGYYKNIDPKEFVEFLQDRAKFELLDAFSARDEQDFYLLAKNKQ